METQDFAHIMGLISSPPCPAAIYASALDRINSLEQNVLEEANKLGLDNKKLQTKASSLKDKLNGDIIATLDKLGYFTGNKDPLSSDALKPDYLVSLLACLQTARDYIAAWHNVATAKQGEPFKKALVKLAKVYDRTAV